MIAYFISFFKYPMKMKYFWGWGSPERHLDPPLINSIFTNMLNPPSHLKLTNYSQEVNSL